MTYEVIYWPLPLLLSWEHTIHRDGREEYHTETWDGSEWVHGTLTSEEWERESHRAVTLRLAK